MKFYDRQQEMTALRKVEDLAAVTAQLTYIMGRRRIGKTELARHAFNRLPTIYFFVSKKSEVLLCEEFVAQAERALGLFIGRHTTFASLFRMLMQVSCQTHFTLIIDEFQTFLGINASVYSDMQNIWDEYKERSHINLVCCGSMYHLMRKIFEEHSEPLYGRSTFKMTLRPFGVDTLKEILADFNPDYTHEDLLTLYMLTGGVAKYVEQLMMRGAVTHRLMIDEALSENSFFLTEGQDILIEEFGRDYSTYFSIVSLIAQGYTSRGDIESVLGIETGGYLQRLEAWYGLIHRNIPFRAKAGSKNVRYSLADRFLTFWFRFVYKYRSSVEIGNLDFVAEVVRRDYETFSGRILEEYFKEKLAATRMYNEIGSYWNRRGENEIDIVAVNSLAGTVTCFEVKRQAARIDMAALSDKAEALRQVCPDCEFVLKGLSMDDM